MEMGKTILENLVFQGLALKRPVQKLRTDDFRFEIEKWSANGITRCPASFCSGDFICRCRFAVGFRRFDMRSVIRIQLMERAERGRSHA